MWPREIGKLLRWMPTDAVGFFMAPGPRNGASHGQEERPDNGQDGERNKKNNAQDRQNIGQDNLTQRFQFVVCVQTTGQYIPEPVFYRLRHFSYPVGWLQPLFYVAN